MTEGTRVIGYVRVSTEEQGRSGVGLEAQRRAIRAECKRRGWRLLRIEEDVASGRSTNGRTGLRAALDACAAGEAQALVSAKLDRLSRSVVDFATLVERSKREGWSVVVLDPAIDLTTPNGRLVAGVLVQVAQWEREIIGARITEALAVASRRTVAERKKLSLERGREVKAIGRPRELADSVRRRIRRLHRSGVSFSEIARRLNAEEVPTAHGGQWHASTVRKIALG